MYRSVQFSRKLFYDIKSQIDIFQEVSFKVFNMFWLINTFSLVDTRHGSP